MNQITIKVELTVLGDKEVLKFYIDENNPEKYVINLNSSNNQLEIKTVFAKLLEKVLEHDVILDYSVAKGYSQALYKEVCEEYIKDLQKEISDTKHLIKSELE